MSTDPNDEKLPAWWPFVSGKQVPWRVLRGVAAADLVLFIVAIVGSLIHNDWSHFAESEAVCSFVGAAGLMVLGGSYGVRNRFAAFAVGFAVMFALFFAVGRMPDVAHPVLVGCMGIGIGFAMIAAFIGVTNVGSAGDRERD